MSAMFGIHIILLFCSLELEVLRADHRIMGFFLPTNQRGRKSYRMVVFAGLIFIFIFCSLLAIQSFADII